MFICHDIWMAAGHSSLPLFLPLPSFPPPCRVSDSNVVSIHQVSTVYLTLSQMARQVDTAHPQGQPGDVVTGRLPYFSRQCLTDVGLDTWIRGHGGMATLLEMV